MGGDIAPEHLYWDDLVDTLQFEAVMDELGIRITKSRKGGTQHEAHCPLPSHPGADNTPSFGINSDALVWNCFTCGDGGLLPLLVVRLEGLEDDPEGLSAWQQALNWLLPFTDHNPDFDAGFVENIEGYLRAAEKPPQRIHRPTLPQFSSSLFDKLEMAPVALFERWGIRDQSTIDHFGIRYDPDRMRTNIRYTGPAIVIPHWFEGQLVGYQERWMGERPNKLPKYTNSTDFPRKETLFDWDSVQPNTIVVESTMTRIRLYEMGYSAVATFGAQMTPRQIQLLSTLKSVTLAQDNDQAGQRAMRKSADLLSELTYVEILPPPDIEKGDLADLEDAQIEAILDRSKAYSPLSPNSK